MQAKIAIVTTFLMIALALGAPLAQAEPESGSADGDGASEPADAGLPCYIVDWQSNPPAIYESPC